MLDDACLINIVTVSYQVFPIMSNWVKKNNWESVKIYMI